MRQEWKSGSTWLHSDLIARQFQMAFEFEQPYKGSHLKCHEIWWLHQLSRFIQLLLTRTLKYYGTFHSHGEREERGLPPSPLQQSKGSGINDNRDPKEALGSPSLARQRILIQTEDIKHMDRVGSGSKAFMVFTNRSTDLCLLFMVRWLDFVSLKAPKA